MRKGLSSPVMAGLVPAIHVLVDAQKILVDARDKPAHDVFREAHGLIVSPKARNAQR